MCYSLKSSILSYSLGMISSIFCFSTKQIVLGTLIFFYSQMQLSELIIWYGIDHNNDNINKIGTAFGKYTLPSHNIAIGLGIILFILLVSKEKLTFKHFIPLIIGILFYLFIVLYIYNNSTYPSITKPRDSEQPQCSSNRLQWPYPYYWYVYGFVISIIISMLYVKPVKTQLFITGAFLITLIVTYMFFNAKTVGSVWCFSSAILAPVIAIIGYIIIKDKNTNEFLT